MSESKKTIKVSYVVQVQVLDETTGKKVWWNTKSITPYFEIAKKMVKDWSRGPKYIYWGKTYYAVRVKKVEETVLPDLYVKVVKEIFET